MKSKRKTGTCTWFVLCALASSIAFAQSLVVPDKPLDKAPHQLLQDPITGVIVNQTITVAGQEFYRSFAMAWRDRAASERYVISVHERPTARQGSRVWIEFRQRKIFQTVLPPGRSQIQAISAQAVEIAHESIVNADVQRMLFRDLDLAADEI